MKLRKHKLTALTLAAVMTLAFSGCGASETKNSTLFKEMETTDLDGNAVDASMFAENKLTVLNLWNLGCSACIMEMPDLDRLNDELAEKGVAVKGLYYNFGEELSDTDRAEIAKVMEDAGADFQQILTSSTMDESSELKNLAAFPNTYFIDSKGNIIDEIAGSDDYDGWMKTIEKVLEKVEDNE